MSEPFTPEQARQHQSTAVEIMIDPIIIEIINYLLARDPSHCTITDEIMNTTAKLGISRIEEIKLQRGLSDEDVQKIIHDSSYKDIVILYNSKGWKGKYDYPAYCESFKPYMLFR